MVASIAVAILAFFAIAVLVCGVALAVRRYRFIVKSYRVLGKVASEWNYRRHGVRMRYYRVDFCLNNGQCSQLRSGVTSASRGPQIGQAVPVLVREDNGTLKAKIGTIPELWFDVFSLSFVGGVGCFVTLPMAYTVLLG